MELEEVVEALQTADMAGCTLSLNTNTATGNSLSLSLSLSLLLNPH